MTYYVHGCPVPESTGCTDKDEARRKLAEKIGEIAAGRDLTPEKATIADLCDLVLVDYRIRRLRDSKTVEWRYKAHIKPALGTLPAAKLTSAAIRQYIEARRRESASDGTINRELSIIRRVSRWAAVCAYHIGTRKGELRRLRWEQVDLDAAAIRFESRQTKGKKPRTAPIYGDMERWIRSQLETRVPGCPFVFHHHSKPVGGQLRGWREACERTGMPDLLFHDLRRSAVRNMKRAGIGDKTAMDISGHKTQAIFDRYDIVDEVDVADAGTKLTEYFAARKQRAKLKRVK
jgi:integrase